MDEPYPNGEICEAALARGIRFCLSDDSHGIDQVAHSYDRVLQFLEKTGIQTLTYLTHREHGSTGDGNASTDERFPTLKFVQVDLGFLKEEKFWGFANTT